MLKMSCCDLLSNIAYHLNKAEDCSFRNCSNLSGQLIAFDDSTKAREYGNYHAYLTPQHNALPFVLEPIRT